MFPCVSLFSRFQSPLDILYFPFLVKNQFYQSIGSSALKLEAQTYKGRNPENGPVFKLIQNNWLKFNESVKLTGKEPAYYVMREMDEFLGCGILARGFLRLKCEDCSFSRLLPFSCKRRGFCPSCCARRMNENAAFMVDNIFPRVPVRQFVLSFPIPVRFWMARNPKLITQLLEIYQRALRSHYIAKAKLTGLKDLPLTGAVTVVQRFGSALNLNVHFHTLMLDGVYVKNQNNELTFHETLKPKGEEIAKLLQIISERMLRALQRKGLVQKLEAENGGNAVEIEPTIEDEIQGAAVQYRFALGHPPGRKIRRIGSLGYIGEQAFQTSETSAIIGGYSLHAGTYIPKNDRARLEQMCRYLLRPPISEERLTFKRSATGADSVIYKLKSEWNDGTKAIILTGEEFIEKIVSIIPQPRIHGTRFHGVLAPHSKQRHQVVPKKAEPETSLKACVSNTTTNETNKKKPATRISWAKLLARVFGFDVEKCSQCGGKIKVLAAILNDDAIKKILNHFGLPTKVPEFYPP